MLEPYTFLIRPSLGEVDCAVPYVFSSVLLSISCLLTVINVPRSFSSLVSYAARDVWYIYNLGDSSDGSYSDPFRPVHHNYICLLYTLCYLWWYQSATTVTFSMHSLISTGVNTAASLS